MKASELIADIKELIETHGDVDMHVNVQDSRDFEFIAYDVGYVTFEGINTTGTKKIGIIHLG